MTVPSVPEVGNGRVFNPDAKSGRAVLPRPGAHLTRRMISTGSRNAVRTAIVLLSYAFLHDNAATFPGSAGYEWTRLLALPPQVRIVELIAIVGLATSLVIVRRSITTAWLIGGCVLFFGLTALSYINHWLVGPVDFARLVYMYLLPILVFVIARELQWRLSGLQTVVRFVLRWILVSAAVSWFQYLYLGYPVGDDITGLNQDAHSNATLLIVGSLILLAEGLFQHRWFRTLLAIGLGATAVLSSDLKVLFVSPFLMALLLWYYAGGSLWKRARMMVKRTVVAVPLAAAMVGVLFYAFNHFDNLSSERVPALLDRALTEPQNFGTVAAYRTAVGVLLEGPRTFLLGVGPFGYSNPISMGQSRDDGPLGRLMRADLVQGLGESGEDARVTLATSLAVEFGAPSFFVLAGLYLVILVKTHAVAVRSQDRTVRRYAAVAVPGLLLLLAVGTSGLFGSLSALSVSWPVMILAGVTARIDARNRAIAKRESLDRRRLLIGSLQGAT